MSSPTSRTLQLLKKEGWTAQVVERFNPYSKTRLDLFGGIDVLACKPYAFQGPVVDVRGNDGILGVQACAAASHATRVSKLLREPRMALWIASGGRLEVWSWGKKGARGKRKKWEVRRQPLTLSDFIPAKEAA